MDKIYVNDPHIVLSKLSLRQKIAQLCIVAAVSNEAKNEELLKRWQQWQPLYCLKTSYINKLVEEQNVGGVIFYGKKTLPQEQQLFTNELQAASPIPLFVAMDAEFGLGDWFEQGAVVKYPCSMAVGATADPNLAYTMGHEIGVQLSSLGVNMDFAPVGDVNCNPDNPVIGSRSLGSDPRLVSSMASAVARGLQDAGVVACAKHFPGHGDTNTDSHLGLPLIPHDRERLEKVELFPFGQLIKAGVKSIMIAHLEVPSLEAKKGLPSSLSYAIVTDLLQKKMQFDGLVITDALGMKATANYAPPGELEIQALEAGVDILLCPVDPIKAIEAIENAVKQGRLQEEDINKKVLKILSTKQWIAQTAQKSPEELDRVLLSEKAKALKKKIYESAVTLLKVPSDHFQTNKPKKTCIIALSNFPTEMGAKSVPLQYVRLPYNTGQDEVATIAECIDADHVVVSIHNPRWQYCSEHEVTAGTLSLITKLKELKKKVTVVVFGSPYSIRHLQQADAIILGYDDTADAQQIVLDIIAGKRKAQGSLPISVEIPVC